MIFIFEYLDVFGNLFDWNEVVVASASKIDRARVIEFFLFYDDF